MTGEDRFGDLGAPGERPPGERPAGEERRSAAERFAELDERQPEPRERPSAPPAPSSRYTWVVGIAFLIAIAAATLNTLRTEGPGALGPKPGAELPVFAAPLASAALENDANVKQDGARSACTVVRPDVVNLCRLIDRGPVAIAFMFTRFADCEPQLDRIERVRRRTPDVTWVGVIIREPPRDAARLVRERGWRFPVALDRDGQISNVYGIGVCPTTVFARRGGRVHVTRTGELDEGELLRDARAISR